MQATERTFIKTLSDWLNRPRAIAENSERTELLNNIVSTLQRLLDNEDS